MRDMKHIALVLVVAMFATSLFADENRPRRGKAREIDPEYPFQPEAAVKAGYKSVPMLILAGTQDPFYGARAPVIPEARAAGLGNVVWMWDGLRQAIDEQENSPHKILIVKAGHVPTVKKPGHSVHNDVDAFIRRAVAPGTTYPFEKIAKARGAG
jgi:pimeloyl-ACP methyl ester carboxylesterase